MDEKYTKVDAYQNSNVKMMMKYKERFGYTVINDSSVKVFALKLDNRLEEIFSEYGSYNSFANTYMNTIYHMVNKVYSKGRDLITYSGSYLKTLIRELRENEDLIPLLMICEFILDYLAPDPRYGYDTEEQDWFASCIAEDLLMSNVNVALYKEGETFEFFPASESLFDSALVEDVLNWLADYPKTRAQYDKSLKMIVQHAGARDIIDNLRLSLELCLKEFFNNEKSIENQKSQLGDFFDSHNVSSHLSNTYITLFKYYTLYNNDEAKHNNTASEHEIDFLLYLTGCFMRFLIQLKRNESKV